MNTHDVFWRLFELTGSISAYMMYKRTYQLSN
ncbi:YqzL family protein [Alkaliphilus oremlandii]|nr:YqzL family protein [Alkaliphilus oremlandii]